MNTKVRRQIPLGFTEETVSEGLHFCYIFNDDAERRRIVAKFLKSGLEGREKVLCLHDTITAGEIVEDMARLGLDVPRYAKDMVMQEAVSTYCPGGHFSIDTMISLAKSFSQEAVREGYVGARATGEVAKAIAQGAATREEVIEYEARINEVFENYPYTACCQYDARLFDGQTIMDVLSVHPMMVVRGQIVKNPFFVDPVIFLRQFRERQQR